MMSLISAKKRQSVKGFTFVELLLVCTLIAVLTSVSFPRLSGSVRSARLEESAEELAEFVRFARAESMRRRLKVRLNIDKEGREYWLSVQDRENLYREQFVEFGDSLLDEPRRLDNSVSIETIEIQDVLRPPENIVFSPDGVSPDCAIRLVDNRDRSTRIEIGPWFDQVKVIANENVQAQ